MTVICTRCGTHHTPSMPGYAEGEGIMGNGCAGYVTGTTLYGRYGSATVDMSFAPVDPLSGVQDGTDPLCDGCIDALEAVGLVGPIGPLPRPVQPPRPANLVSIADIADALFAEIFDA